MSIQHAISPSTGPGDRRSLLTVDLTTSGPVTVITVGGELDMSTVHLLTDRVDQILQQQPLRLVLDLANLTFFGADGIRALHHIHRAIANIAGDLVLRDPSPGTVRVLSLTHTACQFRIHVTSA
jgi:anti-sigma B factor antagonist